jgi:ABC-type sugar transport system permease subunit
MTTSSPPALSPTVRRNPFRWRPDQQWEGYLFVLPSFIGFLVFVAYAVVMSLGISFADWGLQGFREWVGLRNYEALWRDPIFWQSFWNTVFYIATIVPLQIALGLAMALALNNAIAGRSVYRLIYFMPVVTTIVAGAIIFRLLLANNGPLADVVRGINSLTGLALTPPNWLNSTTESKWAVVVLTLWKNSGFTMVVYLAALSPCDAAAHQPDDLFFAVAPDHRRLPAFHRALRDDARRPGQFVAERGQLYLLCRLP